MPSDPKIRFFLIILLLVISLNSCNKEKNDVIPDVYFSFDINLGTDVQFADLNAIGNSAIITPQTIIYKTGTIGFNSNGVIVYRLDPEQFNAYDRTCPHDYVVNGLSIKINIIDFFYADCPECHTRYSLLSYGNPISGVGRYRLKNYRTLFINNILTVSNN